VTELNDALPPEDREWFMQLSMDEREYSDALERIQQLARGLRKMSDTKRLEVLRKKVLEAGTAEDWEELKILQRRVKGSPVEISQS
jgi:hypothetical protein